jgi:hypothetical protein
MSEARGPPDARGGLRRGQAPWPPSMHRRRCSRKSSRAARSWRQTSTPQRRLCCRGRARPLRMPGGVGPQSVTSGRPCCPWLARSHSPHVRRRGDGSSLVTRGDATGAAAYTRCFPTPPATLTRTSPR